MDLMQAVRKLAPGRGASFTQAPVPQPLPDEALVRVQAVGICGSGKHIYEWAAWAEQGLRLHLTFG